MMSLFSWLLLLIAIAISVQANFARTDFKRKSMKTIGAKSRGMENSVSHKSLQYAREQSMCYPELPDFLGKKKRYSSRERYAGKDDRIDHRCSLQCQSCVPEKCHLPNCKCSNTTIPGKIPRYDAPIIVMVTMQNAVENATYDAFLKLFEGLRNPNGCPVTGTYFVSHLYTDYFLVQSLRSKGHEIGDNTISATNYTQDFWKDAGRCTWYQQFQDQMTVLRNLANVTDVHGFRAPYLQPGGDSQMTALQWLQNQSEYHQQFVYDASRVSVDFSTSLNGLLWPYTYDYNSTQDCISPPCPKCCHKGIWEIPLLVFRDRFKNACAALDACNVQTYNDVFRLLYDRLSDRFDSNRAPLILTMDSSWITNPFKFKGTRLFLENALSYKTVYVVSAGKAMDWIRSPVPLADISQFDPWGCTKPDPPVCKESSAKNCTYDSKRRMTSTAVVYQFRTCAQCPPCYPWPGDPEGTSC